MLLGSITLIVGTFLIISNPDIPFNPFPLPTLPPVLEFPTPTLTPSITPTFTPSHTPTPSNTPLPPTETPTPTITPTFTLTPTETLSPTPVVPGIPTNTPNPATPITEEGLPAQQGIVIPTSPLVPVTVDPNVPFPFSAAEPTFRRNTNAQGCNWMSIAGNVLNLFGQPMTDMNVAVEVAGEQFLEVRFSGAAPQYGEAGFEVVIGNSPQRRLFSVRLLGPSGEALSDYIFVTTGETCDQNVAYIEFFQNREFR